MALAVAGCQRPSHVDALCGTGAPGTFAKCDGELGKQHRRGGPAGTGTAASAQNFTRWETAAAFCPCSWPGLCLWQGVRVSCRSEAAVLRAGMLWCFRGLETCL